VDSSLSTAPSVLSAETPAARGRRPEFTDDPMVDRLYSISLALIAELAATRARMDTLERVLSQRAVVPADAIEAYEASPDEQQARARMHQEYLERIFHQSQTGSSATSEAQL
jgi:hypothetical protein